MYDCLFNVAYMCYTTRVPLQAGCDAGSFELQQCYFIQILYIRILSLYVGGNATCGEEVRGCLRISLPATSHLAGKTGDQFLLDTLPVSRIYYHSATIVQHTHNI